MFPRSLACLFVVVAFSGCHRISEADGKAAIECIRANLAATEKGDLDGAMATIHSQSPEFEKTREQTAAIFEQFQLKLELESAKVVRETPDGIEVAFVQVTRKIAGPEGFVDNRVQGTHLLKRDGSTWKIWSTRWTPPRTLDGQPLRAP